MNSLDETHLIGNGYSFIEEGYRVEKDEMRSGLLAGRIICQEECGSDEERKMIGELLIEGVCIATDWEYRPTFKCARRYIKGIQNALQTTECEEVRSAALQERIA